MAIFNKAYPLVPATENTLRVKGVSKPAENRAAQLLVKGIYVYIFLLIFEGALRKWVLTGLAGPLLLVRDPIALWMVIYAQYKRLVPPSPYLLGMVIIGTLGIITAMIFGHGNIFVAIYGARILLIHFPVIFVMGNVLTRDELIKICKSIVLVAVPMTVLIALQFYSPQSAWVNKSVAGDTGAGFTGALGFFRPPGTFSFTNGNSLFYSFASCMIFYFWLNPKLINRVILIAATVALVAAIPLSISRSLIFQIALVTIFVMIAISRQPKFLGRILLALFGGLIFVVVLSQTAFFQKSSEALAARFESASNSEGGLKGTIVDRYLGGLLTAFTSSTDQPFFGYGIGMGTNVGNKLLASSHIYLIAEDEWGREVGEMGPLLGLLMIFIRIGLTFKLAVASYRRIVVNDLLPWLLASFGLLMLSQGGWAQPTSLGFSVVISGMLMASVRNKKVMKRLSFQINDQAISPLGLVG